MSGCEMANQKKKGLTGIAGMLVHSATTAQQYRPLCFSNIHFILFEDQFLDLRYRRYK